MSYSPRKPNSGYGNPRHKSSPPNFGLSRKGGRNKTGRDDFLKDSRNSVPVQNSLYETEKSLAWSVLKPVLCAITPMANLLYTGYDIADTIYKNRNSIKEFVQDAQEGKLSDVATSAISIAGNIALDKLSSLPADCLWSKISGSIPIDRQGINKVILYGIINGLTASEINFAKQFIEKHDIGTSGGQGIERNGDGSFQDGLTKSPKLPKEMSYV
jgi:hypothetical protein